MSGARHLGILTGLGLLAACAGDVTYIEIDLSIEGPNPFLGVKVMRIQATGPGIDPPIKAETTVNDREIWLPPVPVGPDRVITVEGLDGSSPPIPIARGESAPFVVTATEPAKVPVLFKRCTTIVYKDNDGDGFGNPAGGKTACVAKQEGYVDNKSDCDDGDSRAHPGQQSYFDAPSAGTQSFDYNCDGSKELQYSAPVACVKSGGDCTGQGWDTTIAIPPCGQEASFVECKSGSCVPISPATTKKQACR
jgi:hypothetical protein